jgi:hypothetical protein
MELEMTDTKSPSENLSNVVVDRLIQAGLVRAEKRDALIQKIADGTMSGLDWKLEIELALEKGGAK